jgi:hypothetical protein
MVVPLAMGHQGMDLGHGDFLTDGGQVQVDRGGLEGAVSQILLLLDLA